MGLGNRIMGGLFLAERAAFVYRACRLWEISENLHRAELTTLERSKLVAEWVELTGEKTGATCTSLGGRGNKGGVREAERQLGLERTEVRRALKVASLFPEAQDVAREVGPA